MNATIHIVEPDAVVRGGLSALCQAVTPDVRCYRSLSELPPTKTAISPCCTIIGFDSGEINGADIINRVRSADAPAPVILLDNNSSVSSAVHAMRVGAFDVMEKPFVTGLIARVKQALCNPANV